MPPGQSYVFASNHQSIYDIPVLFWTLAFELRILAKASLGAFPFIGWHLARTGHILVDRKKPGTDLFRQMRDLMTAGYSVFVFPEGTRSLDGSLSRFRAGTFLMAIESGLRWLPVASTAAGFVREGPADDVPGDVRVRCSIRSRPRAARRIRRASSRGRCRKAVQSALPPATRRHGLPSARAGGDGVTLDGLPRSCADRSRRSASPSTA